MSHRVTWGEKEENPKTGEIVGWTSIGKKVVAIVLPFGNEEIDSFTKEFIVVPIKELRLE